MSRPLKEHGENRGVSKDGFEFDPMSTEWKLSRDVTVYLRPISEIVSSSIYEPIVKVLMYYAESYSPATVSGHAQYLTRFFKFVYEYKGLVDFVEIEDIINYKSTLDANSEHNLGRIKSVFKKWRDLGYEGLEDDAVELLYSWRLRGNKKGAAVQLRDPYEGPLTEMEFQALRQKLVEAFESDEIGLEEYLLVELLVSTGRRPGQIANLKISDLVEGNSEDGLKEFVLNVPRGKQRGAVWRESFSPFALIPETGMAVSALCQRNREKFRQIAGTEVGSKEDDLPLFTDWSAIRKASQEPHTQWEQLLASQALRWSSSKLSAQASNIVKSLDVPSERTGEPLKIFPLRLRRTLGDRGAREGLGDLVIAELLDHSDTQQVKVYTENVPENVHAINEAMAQQLAPLAQAFSGVIVRNEGDALRGEDPTSRVRSQDGAVGTCGNYSFCGAFGPIACYTCQHFQPWIDGPHEEVLEGLWSERERIQELTGDETMAAVNDRTIVAVTEVVQRCQERLADMSEGGAYDR